MEKKQNMLLYDVFLSLHYYSKNYDVQYNKKIFFNYFFIANVNANQNGK